MHGVEDDRETGTGEREVIRGRDGHEDPASDVEPPRRLGAGALRGTRLHAGGPEVRRRRRAWTHPGIVEPRQFDVDRRALALEQFPALVVDQAAEVVPDRHAELGLEIQPRRRAAPHHRIKPGILILEPQIEVARGRALEAADGIADA